MRILLVNPNMTTSMTTDMVVAASPAVPQAEVVGVTARHGVAAIDGYRDDVVAAAAVVEEITERIGDFDGAVLGCFGEPGLNAGARAEHGTGRGHRRGQLLDRDDAWVTGSRC